MEVLQQIAEDPLQKKATQVEANSIIKALRKLETGFLTAFWSCVLKRTNMTSKHLQSENADLGSSVSLLQSLSDFVGMLRDGNKFEEFVDVGKELSGASGFSVKRTKYSRRTADDESVQGVTMSNCEEFRISTFLVMIDFFLRDLDTRIKAYTKVDELFSFLRQTDVETEVSLAGAIDLYSKERS